MTAGQETLLVRWDDLDALVGALAEQVGAEYDVVLTITRGALVPTGMLAYRLGMRNIVVAAVAYYDDAGHRAAQPTFLQFPSDPLLQGKGGCVSDGVGGTGTTRGAVVERGRLAGGHPTTGVLHYKPARSKVALVPDHHVVATDAWVVYPYKYGT